jgi:hypothetical protein
MIDTDERPFRQTAEQTQRIWARVAQGIAAERRRFRRHAFVAALAGGLIGAALFAGIFWRDGGEMPAPAATCDAAQTASLEGCP